MSKFNTSATKAATFSPVTSESRPSGRTYEGGAGYARDAKSELFLLAVANMVGEGTFYESASMRDGRYVQLVRQATAADPAWTVRLLRWLRSEANLRTAALVGAVEFVKARLDAGLSGASRQAVESVLQRADEPGELLAYWTSTYGRAVPKPVKRGVADAVTRMYDERSYLKWDSTSRGFRFADVLEITHPSARADWQGDLFRHVISERHNRGEAVPESLETLHLRRELMAWPVQKRRDLFRKDTDTVASVLRQAGMTWESVAGWIQGPMTAQVWEALVTAMGYMALLRNLRNFDQAEVSDEVAEQVCGRLAEPEQVARSRQMPMRFLSAYRAAPSLRWAYALETALKHSLANVPALAGRTLILVDRSGSMWDQLSARSDLNRADAAAIFGSALAVRCEDADLVQFGTRSAPVAFGRSESVLRILERFGDLGGTNTEHAIRAHLNGHDRVVIVTDEQAAYGDVGRVVPPTIPLYTWNLAGYRYGHAPSGGRNRHTFGGLTDQAFRMIPLLEAGQNAAWPF